MVSNFFGLPAAAATNTYPYDNIAKIFTTIKSPPRPPSDGKEAVTLTMMIRVSLAEKR